MVPQQSAEQIKTSDVVFIGTVVKKTGHLATERVFFKVQRSLRGVRNGRIYEARGYRTSCDIEFALGARYLYMGTEIWRNSLFLSDKNGNTNKDNIDFVMRETGAKEAEESIVLTGTAEDNCVALSNGIKVHLDTDVFTRRQKTSQVEISAQKSYAAKVGIEQLGINDTFERCEPNSNECKPIVGSLYIGERTNEEVIGSVQLSGDEVYPFRVKLVSTHTGCK